MRTKVHSLLAENRVLIGKWGSTPSMGLAGAFVVIGPIGTPLRILSSGSGVHNEGWEHVSVSCEHRTPAWTEMVFVKDLFWGEDECVMQLHPPKKDYVNHHPYCLHLWKPTFDAIPQPPSDLVGPKT